MRHQPYPQLIDAYITEALNNGGRVTMTDRELQGWFEALFFNEEELEQKTNGNGYLFKGGGRTYRISTFLAQGSGWGMAPVPSAYIHLRGLPGSWHVA